jgi:integrase/recombinase XerC
MAERPSDNETHVTDSLAAICARVLPELASLGDLGVPLVATLRVVERAGVGRSAGALVDPGFALDLLTHEPGVDAALVGRILDFLRSRAGCTPAVSRAPRVTLADAVASYEAGPLALMANGTIHTYRTWTRRLVTAHSATPPENLTAGDLKDLIAQHVLAARRDNERRRSGRSAEENAIGAYRHLWTYLTEKGWASENIAQRLTKPTRAEPNRRPIQPEEAVLLRRLATGSGRDRLLDEVTLTLPERLGLRRIEVCRLRLCDVDLVRNQVEIWGKGDKLRTLPLPPALAELLDRYVEDRRPASVPPSDWRASREPLLRRRPTSEFPLGRACGRRRIEDLFDRLRSAAPRVFAQGDLSLHSYRHAIATFVDARYGRSLTRAVLGHTSRRSATDFYVHVSHEQKAEALTAYEDHVLATELGHQPD